MNALGRMVLLVISLVAGGLLAALTNNTAQAYHTGIGLRNPLQRSAFVTSDPCHDVYWYSCAMDFDEDSGSPQPNPVYVSAVGGHSDVWARVAGNTSGTGSGYLLELWADVGDNSGPASDGYHNFGYLALHHLSAGSLTYSTNDWILVSSGAVQVGTLLGSSGGFAEHLHMEIGVPTGVGFFQIDSGDNPIGANDYIAYFTGP